MCYSVAFDTTGTSCSIALLDDDKIISSFEQNMDFGQSEVLIPKIKEILKKNDLKFSSLNNLFVCVGPGSFTGVRSSISAARIFGLANSDLKVCGVSAFDAYIQALDKEDIADINAVIIETRREDFYVQFFDKQLRKIKNAEALSRDIIIEQLKSKGCLITLIGDGIERFLSAPSGLTFHAIKMLDSLPIYSLYQAGIKMIKSKKIDYPKPLYLRSPDVTTPKG
ncbi:MAG: tRNA (adenosine(37)-N6)-threonylcarbamoyltransferase complex dimerization subunit type 1 TsaB [Alphaproteobacteria bacterium]|nr:tRNA (adenosine(37)-N6)-threonylcarbamoyltransferase complex dimerization subunit type 1 TsaB [Alphaproteobacteria bacterium]